MMHHKPLQKDGFELIASKTCDEKSKNATRQKHLCCKKHCPAPGLGCAGKALQALVLLQPLPAKMGRFGKGPFLLPAGVMGPSGDAALALLN